MTQQAVRNLAYGGLNIPNLYEMGYIIATITSRMQYEETYNTNKY